MTQVPPHDPYDVGSINQDAITQDYQAQAQAEQDDDGPQYRKLQKGDNYLRILWPWKPKNEYPTAWDAGLVYIKQITYWDPTPQHQLVRGLETWPHLGRACPMAAILDKGRKFNKITKEAAHKMIAVQYVINVCDMMPSFRENRDPSPDDVFILRLSKGLGQWLVGQLADPMVGPAAIHPITGSHLKVTYNQGTQDLRNTYVPQWDRQPRPLAQDAQALEAVMAARYDLGDIIKPPDDEGIHKIYQVAQELEQGWFGEVSVTSYAPPTEAQAHEIETIPPVAPTESSQPAPASPTYPAAPMQQPPIEQPQPAPASSQPPPSTGTAPAPGPGQPPF